MIYFICIGRHKSEHVMISSIGLLNIVHIYNLYNFANHSVSVVCVLFLFVVAGCFIFVLVFFKKINARYCKHQLHLIINIHHRFLVTYCLQVPLLPVQQILTLFHLLQLITFLMMIIPPVCQIFPLTSIPVIQVQ